MKVRDNQVTFFRYHRPIDPRTGYVASNKGTCFCIVMDYDLRALLVSASVCNGDNFSKSEATTRAVSRMQNEEYFTFGLDDFTSISTPTTLIPFLQESFATLRSTLRESGDINTPKYNLVTAIVQQLSEQ